MLFIRKKVCYDTEVEVYVLGGACAASRKDLCRRHVGLLRKRKMQEKTETMAHRRAAVSGGAVVRWLLLLAILLFLPAGRVWGQSAETEEAESEEWGVLTVVYPVNRKPEIYQSEDTGSAAGIYAEIGRLIEEYSGLTFEYVGLEDYGACYEAIENEEADLLLCTFVLESYEEVSFLRLSQPYAFFGLTVVGDKDTEISDSLVYGAWEEAEICGLQDLLEDRFPDWTSREYESTEAALIALSAGEVDVVVMSSLRVNTALSQADLEDLGALFVIEANNGVCVGIAENENADALEEILNDAISQITDEQLIQITVNQQGEAAESETFLEYLQENWKIIAGIALICLCLLWVLLLSLYYRRRQRKLQHEAHISYLRHQLELQVHQYNKLREQQEELRIYRHDWKNHTLALSSCLARGDVEEAKQYLADMTQAMPGKDLIDTGNPVLDAILSDALDRAEETGARVETEIAIPVGLKMEPMDVGSIFANCFENAVEALKQLQEEGAQNLILKVVLREKQGNLIFRMQNSTPARRKRADGRYSSWKGGKDHGLGIRSAEDTAEKYAGSVRCYIKDNLFCTDVTLCGVWEEDAASC